jgi:hypothetical protein
MTGERSHDPKIRRPERITIKLVTRLKGNFQMSKQSEHLREQARRAERLALTISDLDASVKLRDLSKQYDADAERLEKTDGPISGPKRGDLKI